MGLLAKLRTAFTGRRPTVVQSVYSVLISASMAQAQPLPAPPANDHLTNAATVTGTTFELAADLAAASAESFEPWKAGWAGHTAWWRWTAPQAGVYAWEVRTDAQPATLAVYRRDSFQQLTLIAETYWKPTGAMLSYGEPVPRGSFQAEAGLEYLLQVDVALSSSFWIPLWIYPHLVSVVFAPPLPAPTNDTYAARVTLPGTNVNFGGSLFAASVEPYEPRLPGEAMQRTLWWQWTAPGPGTAIIRSQNTAFVPLVGVFRRGPWNQLELFAHSGSEFGNQCLQFWGARPELRWDTATDSTYDVVVDRYPETDPTAEVSLRLEWLPAPSNDGYENPQWLNGNDLSLIVSNTSATSSPGEFVVPGATNSKSVWFAWQSPGPGILQITTNEPARFAEPDFVPLPSGLGVISTYGPGPCAGGISDLHPLPPFIPVWGLFRRCGGNPSYFLDSEEITLWRNVLDSCEYRIGLDGLEGSAGVTVLNLLFTPPPSNDLFANRIVLPQSAVRVTGRTFAATVDAGQPSPPVSFARSAWWEWRAPQAGLWALRMFTGGAGENYFVVYRGTNATAANEVKQSFADPVVFTASAGETFQIGVYANTAWGGNVEFELTKATAPELALREVAYPYPWDKHWGLFASGTNGLRYLVDSSTNLHDWWPVLTNQAFLPQEILRVEPGLPRQFFRTRLEQ